MSRRANRCRNADVSLPYAAQVGPATHSAQDLTPEQLWLLYELSLRNGGHPADRAQTLFGFAPTETDRDIIERRCDAMLGVWEPWVRLMKGVAS